VVNRDFWDLLRSREVTSFGGVPYFYEMLSKLRFGRHELPALRYITQAGGKLAPSLAREITEVCLRKKVRFYLMYGQAEATARMTYLCATEYPDQIATIGTSFPDD